MWKNIVIKNRTVLFGTKRYFPKKRHMEKVPSRTVYRPIPYFTGILSTSTVILDCKVFHMGLGHSFGATPMVQSESLQLKLQKNLRILTVEENRERSTGSKFERPMSIRAPSRRP